MCRVPFLVPYARSMGGSSVDIGMVYSSMFVVRLVMGAPIGPPGGQARG
jgi:hypothetical protein